MEKAMQRIQGIYRDILQGADGQVLYDSGWRSNMIVNQCHMLLAMFVANEKDVHGIKCLAVGEGDPSWDTSAQASPSPAPTETNLVKRFATDIPFSELTVEYLDEEGKVTGKQTSCLQIRAKLGTDYPELPAGLNTYPLREFGLFGHLGDQEYMINCVRHPVIHKDKQSTLTRTLCLHF